MKALCVLYAGRLTPEAFEKVPGAAFGSSFSQALAAARRFPEVQKVVLFGLEGKEYPDLSPDVEVLSQPSWTRLSLLKELSRLSLGFDYSYFAWADCPLLDPVLAASLAERHKRYRAEYSYADGWPYGFAPELVAPGTAGILAKLAENDDGPVERDTLFNVIQKDINAFDIETEISPWDLRPYRLCLAADSKRNLLLLTRLMADGLSSAMETERFIGEKAAAAGEALRTLPAFFNIQVSGACPQSCSFCPWPACSSVNVTERKDFMPVEALTSLLDKIERFAGDAVIGLSLWGELALHPQHQALIEMVLSRPALSLVIETSGVGWKEGELQDLALAASRAAPRKNQTIYSNSSPLSWIVSLDAHDPARYKEIRGPGFSEAQSNAKTLLSLFPGNAYVQAVRVKDFEDDIENFYRSWKGEDASRVIIQKYDDFAGALPKLQATDLSPVKRRACWHIQRDMNILLDGRVPNCKADLEVLKGKGEVLGNALTEELPLIWERGAALYKTHCKAEYPGLCALCDEFYTYNF